MKANKNVMNKKDGEYATKDFGLSVYLATVEPDNIKFKKIEQINDREVNFVFNNPDKCTDFAAKYFSDSGFVNARSYAGKMRDFKALLYSVIPRAR